MGELSKATRAQLQRAIRGDDNAMLDLLARAARSGVIDALLAGNDTGCFTTEQYRAEYSRKMFPHFDSDSLDLLWFHTKPESHLRSLPDLVREVSPGVWAAAENHQEK